MRKLLSAMALAALAAGCFDEPTPAYRTVPEGARVYLQDRGLSRFSVADSKLQVELVDYLNLDRNQLVDVGEVAQLVNLKWLRLNSNRLSQLPDLSALVKLRRVYLKNNHFTEVPSALKDLPALTDIELSGNAISEIPEWFAKKPNLAFLSFNRTQLHKLPDDLSAWKTLKALQLGDTPIGSDKDEMARIRKALPDTAIVF